MTSELRVTTLSNATGNGPAALTQQAAAKAHLNFNMTGTPAIRESLNFSSITDGGTGTYTAVYTNNMGNANYTPVTSGEYDAGVHAGICMFNYDATGALPTANFPVKGFKTNDTALVDVKYSTAAIFGDLA